MRVAKWFVCVAVASFILAGTQAFTAEPAKPPAGRQPAAPPNAQPAEAKRVPAEQNPRYYADLAGVNFRYGENQKAVELYTRAIELQAGDKIDPGLAFGLGQAYMALKQVSKADGVFELPLPTMDAEQKPRYLLEVAKLYKAAELYEKCEKLLLLAKSEAKAERDQTMVIQALLELYKATPLGKRAVEAFEKRLAENPKDSEALKSLMDLYLYDTKLEKAAEMASRYAELHPDDVGALRDLAFFYTASGELEKTIDACARLVSKDPENKADYYQRIMYLYTELNKFDKVEEWADKAAKDNVKSDATYEALAESYVKAKKPDKALACLKKASESAPANARAGIAYGKLLSEMGRKDEAKRILDPLKDLDDPRLKAQVQQLLLDIYESGGKTQPRSDDKDAPKPEKKAPEPR